jgi:predicted DNA binding CopG/RHH family protein
MTTSQIPKTDSIEALAQFWDTHDLTDFEDELEEVTAPVFVANEPAPAIKIRLPFPELEMLREIAKAKGTDQDTLVREWVLEKLHAA